MKKTTITINAEKKDAIQLFMRIKDELKQAGVKFISDTTFEYDEKDTDLIKRIKDITAKNCPT